MPLNTINYTTVNLRRVHEVIDQGKRIFNHEYVDDIKLLKAKMVLIRLEMSFTAVESKLRSY